MLKKGTKIAAIVLSLILVLHMDTTVANAATINNAENEAISTNSDVEKESGTVIERIDLDTYFNLYANQNNCSYEEARDSYFQLIENDMKERGVENTPTLYSIGWGPSTPSGGGADYSPCYIYNTFYHIAPSYLGEKETATVEICCTAVLNVSRYGTSIVSVDDNATATLTGSYGDTIELHASKAEKKDAMRIAVSARYTIDVAVSQSFHIGGVIFGYTVNNNSHARDTFQDSFVENVYNKQP